MIHKKTIDELDPNRRIQILEAEVVRLREYLGSTETSGEARDVVRGRIKRVVKMINQLRSSNV